MMRVTVPSSLREGGGSVFCMANFSCERSAAPITQDAGNMCPTLRPHNIPLENEARKEGSIGAPPCQLMHGFFFTTILAMYQA